MDKSLGSRLIIARKGRNLSQKKLAEMVKKSQSTIAALETGRNKECTFIMQLAAALQVDPLWLETGKGTMIYDGNTAAAPDFAAKKIPLISFVQAGAWAEVIDNFAVGDAEEWLQTTSKHSPCTFALRVQGKSMYNPGSRESFDDDDIIFVDPERPYCNGSLVVVRLEGEKEATFKKLIIEPNGAMYLKPLNPNYPEQIIPIADDAKIVGVVYEKTVRY